MISILRDGGDKMQSHLSETEDKTNISQLDIETAVALEEAKNNYRKIVRAGIAKWVKDFQNGDVTIKTVDDLKKLIEIDLELLRDDF